MIRKNLIPESSIKIRHVGILELDDFYRWLKRWFKFKGYWQGEKCEVLYEEIIKDPVKNIRIKLETYKDITPYIRGRINVEFVLIAVGTKKIPVDGKEVKVHTGDFEVGFKTIVERTKEQGFLRQLYDDVVNKQATDHYVQEIVNDSKELTEEVKTIFNQYV